MNTKTIIAAGVAALLLSSTATAFPERPVGYGGDPVLDTCGYGVVEADATIALSNGEHGVVPAGTMVSTCDAEEVDGEEYLGIIFSEEGLDCELGDEPDAKQVYPGPCERGWIRASFFRVIAG